ncbi:MAG: cytochrome c [Dehalococcoidia bacterium]|nr:cytochrome c [Dehalococcoidia bacterium]
MRRLSIPPGPILGAIMMSGLAFTLIAVVIARSPYTHGNLRPEGYNRTDIIYLGEEHPFEGIGLADPALASTGDPAQDGGVLFFGYGCASCHGLQGKGAAVGKDLSKADAEEISEKVRQGPKTMPAFESGDLTDADLEKLIAFLKSKAE